MRTKIRSLTGVFVCVVVSEREREKELVCVRVCVCVKCINPSDNIIAEYPG